MDEQELARQEAYKKTLKAQRDKLKEDVSAAVAAEEFATTNAGKLMTQWVNTEVNSLVVDILDEKLSYDDYVQKRAKVAALREFLQHLDKKAATKEAAQAKIGEVNGQLKDIADVERQQRANQPPNA